MLMRAVRGKESKEEGAILPMAAFDASLRGLGVPQSWIWQPGNDH